MIKEDEMEENIMFLGKNVAAAMQNPIHNRRGPDSLNMTGGLIPGTSAVLSEEEPADMKNKQITELTDMVKTLLEEQRTLKEKLD